MNEDQISNLYTVFKTLPTEIRGWLVDEQVNQGISDIAQQFVLSDDQKLKMPFLLLRLVTQNLPPEQFQSALHEALQIDHDLTEKITDALTEKILAPIKQPLQFAGVNIDLLKFTTPVDTQGVPREARSATETPPSSPRSPQPASSVQNPEPRTQSKPFVLHEEPSFSPAGEQNAPDTKPSFVFNPAETMGVPHESAAPAKVIVERVVHYSPLRTPLNQTNIPQKTERGVDVPKTKWFV